MKRILLTLLAIVVVIGLLGAVGFAGYRYGYVQGAQVPRNGDATRPGARLFDDFDRGRMPMHEFGFGRGPSRMFGGFPMMGFGFFGPLLFLGRILILALVVWLIYWLFARSGWRLTRQPVNSTPTTVETKPDSPEHE